MSANNLCDYYSFEQNPGNELGTVIQSDEFAYLDAPELAKSLLDFADDKIAKVRFFLPQIHCASCIWLLENLTKIDRHVLSSRVNFNKKEIAITYNAETGSLRKVVELLTTFGYKPVINLDSTTKTKKANNRKVYYQLGVAGFCFGNIMLTSFPEYVGLDAILAKDFAAVFRWLNLGLALPVLFYSASDYLQNALSAVQTKIINLDVPIVLGLLALFGRSVYEVASGTGAGYFDSLAGFVFFLLLGKVFQARTYSTLSFERDFKSFFPLSINKIKGEEVEPIKVTKLEIGDEIRVRHGEIIPVDSVLLSENAKVDYSFVTGESDPVVKGKGEFMYAGGRQTGSAIDLIVSKTVEESYLADLWKKDLNQNGQSGLTSIVDQVGKYFTAVIIGVALITLIGWLFIDASKAFLAFTSVLIVACPCALALSIPFTNGTAMRVLAKAGFFLKDSSLMEKLGRITHLVFDKTGTLTFGAKSVQYVGEELSHHELEAIKATTQQSAHPVSVQVNKSIEASANQAPENYGETTGSGIQGRYNGLNLRLGSANWLGAATTSESSLHVEVNGVYKGYFFINHQYRMGVVEMLKGLSDRFRIFLLSGDNSQSKQDMSTAFGSEQVLLYNQKPHDKLDFVNHLKSDGHQVAMIGDGLNDSGALHESNFGISVTDDTNNFTPASSAIMLGKQLPKLPTILAFAGRTRRIVYAAFALSFAYNLVGMSFAVQGKLSPIISAILMPLSSITVVAFVVVTTLLSARKMRLI